MIEGDESADVRLCSLIEGGHFVNLTANIFNERNGKQSKNENTREKDKRSEVITCKILFVTVLL